MKLCFVGAGKMATAMAGGLVNRNVLTPEEMGAADISPEARVAFTEATGVACAANARDVVPDAEVILLAVKPQYAADAVASIAKECAGKLIVSIAAGLPLARLGEWFGSERIVRVMPNTPLMVHKGASVYACADGVSDEDRAFVQTVFGTLGIAHEMPEKAIDAVTALSGSGPAYVFEMIQALVEAAVAVELPADIALELAVQTVAGAAEMVQRRLGTPDDLRVAVTSPGGTTAAGLAVLEKANFRGLIADAVRAARDRSIELGKAK